MNQLREWPTIVAMAAGAIALVLVVQVVSLNRELDETRDAVARLGVQAAIVDEALSGLSGPLAGQLESVIAELDAFSTSTISIPIDIDEVVPIVTDIEFDRTIDVPIQTSLPINETIDTTITVQGPFGVDIDLDVTVPIDLELPIDLEVQLPVNETIPIDTTVPVRLTFPIEFEVAGTPLADLAIALRDGLAQLADSFS